MSKRTLIQDYAATIGAAMERAAQDRPQAAIDQATREIEDNAEAIAKTDARDLRDVAIRLRLLCNRMRLEMNTDHAADVVDYMLAESVRDDVERLAVK